MTDLTEQSTTTLLAQLTYSPLYIITVIIALGVYHPIHYKKPAQGQLPRLGVKLT